MHGMQIKNQSILYKILIIKEILVSKDIWLIDATIRYIN